MQSVALRLIAEREAEREAFKPDEWWTVDPLLTNVNGKPFRVSVNSACPSDVAYVALSSSLRARRQVPVIDLANCFLLFGCKADQKYSQARCVMQLCNGRISHLMLTLS